MCEPYHYTSHHNFKNKKGLKYPGKISFNGKIEQWNKKRMRAYLQPLFAWAKKNKILPRQIVASEFGCYRRNPGCDNYLADALQVFDQAGYHWGFYSFREDAWDGYDYEVGTKGLGWQYWQYKEAERNPQIPRNKSSFWRVLEERLEYINR